MDWSFLIKMVIFFVVLRVVSGIELGYFNIRCVVSGTVSVIFGAIRVAVISLITLLITKNSHLWTGILVGLFIIKFVNWINVESCEIKSEEAIQSVVAYNLYLIWRGIIILAFFFAIRVIFSDEFHPLFRIIAGIFIAGFGYISFRQSQDAEEFGGKWFDPAPFKLSYYIKEFLLVLLAIVLFGSIFLVIFWVAFYSDYHIWIRILTILLYITVISSSFIIKIINNWQNRQEPVKYFGRLFTKKTSKQAKRLQTVARFWKLVCCVSAPIGFFCLYLWVFIAFPFRWLSIPITIATIFGIILSIKWYKFFLTLSKNFEQRLALFLAETDDRKFFVILRSFSDSELFNAAPEPAIPDVGSETVIISDIAQDIRKSLENEGPLVSFDHRILTFKEDWTLKIKPGKLGWQAAVKDAIVQCRAVFILPGTTPGIIEEMEFVCDSNNFEKVLILMPPTERWAWYTGKENKRRKRWTEIADKLKAMKGFQLPDYNPDGMIFLPNSDYSVRYSASLKGDLDRNLYWAILDLDNQLNEHFKRNTRAETMTLSTFINRIGTKNELYEPL